MPFWANSTLASPIAGTMHLGPHLRKTPPHHWRLHHFFLPYIFEQKNWLNKIIVLHWRGVPENQVVWWLSGGMIPRHKLYQHWARAQSHRVAIPKAHHKRVFTGDKPSSHCNLLKGSWQKKGSWGKPHTINSTNGAFSGHIWRTAYWFDHIFARQVCIKSYKPLW